MQEYNYNGKINIGVDHGYGNMKTAHRIFRTGVEAYEEEPIVSKNYLKWKDMYYVIGESHLTYQGDKTTTPEFYVLTLAAIAEELKIRNVHKADIILAVGLPLAWVKSQKSDFKNYLLQEQDLDYEFCGERYRIHIAGVDIFPQGIAAIYDQGRMDGYNIIADIGNGTMNVMQINDGKPLEKSIVTEKYGVSICVKEIQNELSKDFAEHIDESMIEKLLCSGCKDKNNPLAEKTRKIAQKYANEILKRLSGYGYKKGLVNLYIIGGGGCLLKHYTDISENAGVKFIDDIHANAKGYEYLAMKKCKAKERR